MSNKLAEDTNSFFDEIKNVITQRFGSQLYLCIGGAFIIDNWRDVFYLIVSDSSVVSRFDYINKNPFSVSESIVYGLIIVILMPFVSRLVEWIHLLNDWLKNKISFYRDSNIIRSMGKIKELEKQENFKRDESDAINKAKLDKIDADSKYYVGELEKKYKTALTQYESISYQLNEYQNIRSGFCYDISRGVLFINEIEKALNDSLPHLDSLIMPSNSQKAVNAHNTIMEAFKNIDVIKIKKYLNQIPEIKDKLPESTTIQR